MLGSGALFLSVSTFNLAVWILGAIAAVLGLVSSTKSAVERWTLRHLARKKQRRLYRQYAEMLALRFGTTRDRHRPGPLLLRRRCRLHGALAQRQVHG